MKRRDFKHVVKSRKLTDEEAMEENIYRTQLIRSWGWRSGHSPQDERRKQQEKDAEGD